MVVVSAGSMLTGAIKEYLSYSNGWANLRELTGGCGLADDVLVEPDANTGFLAPMAGTYGPLGPLGGSDAAGFSPDGAPEHTLAESIWQSQAKSELTTTGTGPPLWNNPGSTAPASCCPTAWTPRGYRWQAASLPVPNKSAH